MFVNLAISQACAWQTFFETDEQIVLVNVCCGAQMQNKIEMFVKQWLKVWLAGNKLENYHVHVHNTFAKAIYVIQLNFQEHWHLGTPSGSITPD